MDGKCIGSLALYQHHDTLTGAQGGLEGVNADYSIGKGGTQPCFGEYNHVSCSLVYEVLSQLLFSICLN